MVILLVLPSSYCQWQENMGATRTVLTRKALTRKVLRALGIKIGLSVGPDSLPQELGIENIALDRVVRLGWVRLGLM